jgi:hypothetical protein
LPWVGYDSKAKLCLPSGMRCWPLKRQCLVEEPPSFIAICTRAGRRTPEASAHAFLTVIARNPQAVIVALHGEQKTPASRARSAPRSQKGRAARKK